MSTQCKLILHTHSLQSTGLSLKEEGEGWQVRLEQAYSLPGEPAPPALGSQSISTASVVRRPSWAEASL